MIVWEAGPRAPPASFESKGSRRVDDADANQHLVGTGDYAIPMFSLLLAVGSAGAPSPSGNRPRPPRLT